ncbi:FAD-binding oxidoreductase [Rhodococcus jostii]|uniref:FAD-binding protein n=1 Tax=Rhodococcus jostii TaxID=132919 RepID=A0ABU4CU14_RHOJO|nr:FAD-binding protein [Rhodococcus jostii]MDV6286787.1 FAD-binding protein [Rhodococcus jostii]
MPSTTDATPIDRRSVLRAISVATAAGVAGAAIAPAPTAVAAPPGNPTYVDPRDPRYDELTTGVNQRWVAKPDYIAVPRTTDDVVTAVQRAVDERKTLTVRSGGHCLADHVFNATVTAVIDMSTMTDITYDDQRKAFGVEAGALLLNVYDELYKSWGVTIPGGFCYSVGIGGHVCGGGFGLLSRRDGLTVDHLYAVEIVVVGPDRTARAVFATRDADDPHRDLWWGCTGGGGGNFGVITRYWFRSPEAHGSNPRDQLVTPPDKVTISTVTIPWESLTRERFMRLLRNVGQWYEANSAPESPYIALSGSVTLTHATSGAITLLTQIAADAADSDTLLGTYLREILAGVTDSTTLPPTRTIPWLRATRLLSTGSAIGNNPMVRSDNHAAYHLRSHTEAQAEIIYAALTSDSIDNDHAMVVINPVGGRVGAVGPGDTAVAQRGAIMKVLYQSLWTNPADDAANIAWATRLFRTVYAATGNVPVPNDQTDGCYINYPDTGTADPDANLSGRPWSELYYKSNYPRLQQIKSIWDPLDIFHHAQSIQLPQ